MKNTIILLGITFMLFCCAGKEGPAGPEGPKGEPGPTIPRHGLMYFFAAVNDTTYLPYTADTQWINFEMELNSYSKLFEQFELMLTYSKDDPQHVHYRTLAGCKLLKSLSQGDLKNVTTIPSDENVTTTGAFSIGEVYFSRNQNEYLTKFKILNQKFDLSVWWDYSTELIIEYYFYHTTEPDFSLF